MKTKSRDGRFIISASDDEKKVMDVYLKAVKKVTLNDVADAIRDDCFPFDTCGLQLPAETLHCHVTVGNKTYHFTVHEESCAQCYDILVDIAEQLKL